MSYVSAIQLQDRILFELHPSIAKMANVKNGDLFLEEITQDGILLRRTVEDSIKEDVGARVPSKTPTASTHGGASNR